jgi:membrane-associated phospholipid phosphatase
MIASRYRRVLPVFIWVVAFALALSLDRVTADSIARLHPLDKRGIVAWALKLPGYFPVTLLIAIAIGFFHRRSWRMALPLVISGPLVGLAYTFLKWIVGRHRPSMVIAGHLQTVIAPFAFHPFAGGIVGLIHAESGLSFPSGHTALAFATAMCLARAFPRWGKVLFLAAAFVGAERILENAHYLSDVVAGAGVGILCGLAASALCERLWPTPPPPDKLRIPASEESIHM